MSCRQFSVKEDNFKRVLRFYRNLVKMSESEWMYYVRSPTYEDDEFDFRMFYRNLEHSKKVLCQ